ncbi:MAG: hypothetical protein AB8C84_05520 [Oligoflexales bacterium]
MADAWYAAEAVAQPVVDAGSTLISRVSRNAVGYEEPIALAGFIYSHRLSLFHL